MKRSAIIVVFMLCAAGLCCPGSAGAKVIEEEVFIVPLGTVDEKIVEKIKEKLPGSLPMTSRMTVEPARELPETAYDPSRKQYNAQAILEYMMGEIRLTRENECALVITNEDIFAPGTDFVYGFALARKNVVVVSLFRLRNENNGGTPDNKLLVERAIKEALYVLGHSWRLADCPSTKCVMHHPAALSDMDKTRNTYCYKCRIGLDKRYGSDRSLFGSSIEKARSAIK